MAAVPGYRRLCEEAQRNGIIHHPITKASLASQPWSNSGPKKINLYASINITCVRVTAKLGHARARMVRSRSRSAKADINYERIHGRKCELPRRSHNMSDPSQTGAVEARLESIPSSGPSSQQETQNKNTDKGPLKPFTYIPLV